MRGECGSVSASACRSGSTSSMRDTAKAREVVDGVVEVFLPLPMRPTIVNVYLIRAGGSWTLVDTGMNTEDSRNAFRGALTEIGIPPAAVTRLVGTHHHVDHFGTSAPFRELTHAEVYLHPLEAERASIMGHMGGIESTDYLRRQGVPSVPPDQQLPPPSRFFGTWYAPARRRSLARGHLDARTHARPLLPPPQARRHPLRRRSPAAEDHPARRPLAERPRESARRLPRLAREDPACRRAPRLSGARPRLRGRSEE